MEVYKGRLGNAPLYLDTRRMCIVTDGYQGFAEISTLYLKWQTHIPFLTYFNPNDGGDTFPGNTVTSYTVS
jgi:hypothetical protein